MLDTESSNRKRARSYLDDLLMQAHIAPSPLECPICFPSFFVFASLGLAAEPCKKIGILHLSQAWRTGRVCRTEVVQAGLLPDEGRLKSMPEATTHHASLEEEFEGAEFEDPLPGIHIDPCLDWLCLPKHRGSSLDCIWFEVSGTGSAALVLGFWGQWRT